MKYYRLTKIKKYDCPYRLIIGKRSNGKTYAVLEEGLKLWAKTGKKIAYIRRYREDLTAPNIGRLFNPQKIAEITRGEYVEFEYRSKQFKAVDSEGKKKTIVCECFSLNAWERQKGADRGDFGIVFFDEFITRDAYLTSEVDIFLDVLSTIVRDRGTAQIYLVANTISQFCPYFPAFGIDIKELTQGQIVQISDQAAIEWCFDNGEASSDKYFKGFQHGKMISGGSWDIRRFPRLYPKSHLDYTFLLRFFVRLHDRTIAGEVLTGNEGVFLYFYPFTGEPKDPEHTIIYGVTDTNALHCKDFGGGVSAAHSIIADLIRQEKAFYSDDMTGEAVSAFIRGGAGV